MRTAKIGFNNKAFGTKYNVINLAQIVQLGETKVDTNVLFEYRIVRDSKLPLKIIGTADLKLDKKYEITCNKISAGAKTSIEEAGGTVTIL
jgi:large subunit ribosomal protein L15